MRLNYASEYRAAARETLRGKWAIAVIVGLVASLLGGTSGGGDSGITLNFNLNSRGITEDFAHIFDGNGAYGYGYGYSELPSEFYYALFGILGFIMLVSLIIGLIYLIIGGSVATGYAQFNMKLANGEPAGFSDLFAFFRPKQLLRCFLANLIQTAIILAATFIGALLLVIPGIIAAFYLSYSYSMTFYILADHPEYGPWQAIKESYRMMRGHKFRFFCLQLSFIGWAILAAFTCGIGYLFLTPYEESAYSIFYLELAGDYDAARQANPEVRY